MVKYEIAQRSADASRVYMMGASSGAMLTEAMLAVYPDVFKAGAEFSGVPAGCWSDGWSAASNWGGTCAAGNDSMSAEAWGALVHGMYPGYSGFRPRIQLWHGTGDMTINKNNQTEAIKEWTNVLGLNMAPNSTDTSSTPGFTIQKWQNTCGFTVLEAHTQANGGHTTPIDSGSVISFFGLDKTGADPQIAMCGTTGNGGAGRSGAGGGSSAGGSPGAGGSPSGGAAGSSAGGGVSSGTGGTTTATGGGGGTPSSSAGGGVSSGTGGTTTTTGTAGASAAGTGGHSATGGTSAVPGAAGTNGELPNDSAANGCTCKTGGAGAGSPGGISLPGLALAFALTRRLRRRR